MLAVVSHDAGGAEVVSSYLRRSGDRFVCALAGPAVRIFERKLGAVDVLPLDEVIARGQTVLCGTSWSSDLERRAIAAARAAGKRSVAFIDHWTSYRDRFDDHGTTVLPDEIWVGDAMAEAMVIATFPGVAVTRVDNPYFADIRDELSWRRRAAVPHHGVTALYVCEPIGEQALRQHGDARHWGYDEHDGLRYFLRHVDAIQPKVDRVVVRPHPSESPSKYAWAPAEATLPLTFGGGRTLVEEIVDSDLVAGCESMAMVIGLLGGKPVITTIPPGGRPCSLPHPEIVSLQAIAEGQPRA